VDDVGFEVDERTRTIVLLDAEPATAVRVPAVFGAFKAVERRGDYLVVNAEHGKASYHLEQARGSAANRVGFMAWASLRKTIRKLCLLPAAARRVDMQITYYRNGRGNGSAGAHGRVLVDRSIIAQGRDVAHHLGKSLEAYLHLTPDERITSDVAMIQAFAVLDRGVEADQVRAATPNDPSCSLWPAFMALREALEATPR